jgi:hypothetical protein
MSTATVTNPWKMRPTSGEGGDWELPPGGTYPAILVGLIDLGTHEREFQGSKSEARKVLLVWELTGEYDSKGESFKVAKDFTLSLNSKAKLRAFLEGWEGRKFKDDEEIDLLSFVNRECVLNVTEGTSNAGKRFVDVASATKPMRGLVVPPRSVEPYVFTLADSDLKADPGVPDWVPPNYGRKVADEIRGSKEWITGCPF